MILQWKQRPPVRAVEKVNKSLLAGLSDRVHFLAVVLNGHQSGRRWKISVPDIVPDALEVPDSLPGFRIQCQQAVGEQVVAHPIASVEIERC